MNTDMMSFIGYCLLNVSFIVLISPFYLSLIKKVKAYAQGRRGPPLLQTYYNLAKLLKKERVYSKTSSQVTRMTPYVNLAVMLTAAIYIPVTFIPSPGGVTGSVIVFIYLLALARFFMALGGLDAGSTFGGMGSSREMSIAAVIEPITILAFAALALALGTTNIYEMFTKTSAGIPMLDPSLVLVAIPLFIVLIVETARVPVDNPETHLELTMVHEGMLLEYSGRDLFLMELSGAIKQTLLMALLINVIFPHGLAGSPGPAVAVAMAAFFVKGALLSILIGVSESSVAKTRLFGLPGMFMTALFFSVLTILLEVFG